MPTVKIQPLRPYMMFTDQNGFLTKDAYDFLFTLFQRVGGSLSSLNAATLQDHTWDEPGAIGQTTPSTARFSQLTATGPINLATNVGGITMVTSSSPITIRPAIPGNMDNMNIGQNIPSVGRFSELAVNGGFGCNGTDPQLPVPISGIVPVSTATVSDVASKVNEILAALQANGIVES